MQGLARYSQEKASSLKKKRKRKDDEKGFGTAPGGPGTLNLPERKRAEPITLPRHLKELEWAYTSQTSRILPFPEFGRQNDFM